MQGVCVRGPLASSKSSLACQPAALYYYILVASRRISRCPNWPVTTSSVWWSSAVSSAACGLQWPAPILVGSARMNSGRPSRVVVSRGWLLLLFCTTSPAMVTAFRLDGNDVSPKPGLTR